MDLFVGIAVVALLLLASLLSSKISAHINMPCLLLFLVVGMLAGTDGIGKLHFDDLIITEIPQETSDIKK